jgi:hypothetical protein
MRVLFTGFQCRTVEVFQSLGIAHRVVHEGCEVAEVVFYNPDPDVDSGKGGLKETQRVVDVSCQPSTLLRANAATYRKADVLTYTS